MTSRGVRCSRECRSIIDALTVCIRAEDWIRAGCGKTGLSNSIRALLSRRWNCERPDTPDRLGQSAKLQELPATRRQRDAPWAFRLTSTVVPADPWCICTPSRGGAYICVAAFCQCPHTVAAVKMRATTERRQMSRCIDRKSERINLLVVLEGLSVDGKVHHPFSGAC